MKKTIVLVLICMAAGGSFVNAKSPVANREAVLKHFSDEGNKIKFTLGTKTFELQSYNLNYYAVTPEKQTLNNLYQGTIFSVGIRTSKIDQELLDWLLSENQEAKTAEIVVTDGDTGNVIKTLSFTGVTTNSYSENYNAGVNYGVNQFINLSFRYKTVRVKLKK